MRRFSDRLIYWGDIKMRRWTSSLNSKRGFFKRANDKFTKLAQYFDFALTNSCRRRVQCESN